MINVQKWLDEEYPLETRVQIKELSINDKYLTGSLNLRTFPQLVELNCSYNDLTNLKLTNCPQLKKIDCSTNNFSSLDVGNNLQLEELYCSSNKKLSTLQLGDNKVLRRLNCSKCQFTNLTLNDIPTLRELLLDNNHLHQLALNKLPCLNEVYLSINQLTNESLTISNCPQIRILNLSSNYFNSLVFLRSLNTDNLIVLLINDNKFPGNLTFFQELFFTNLEELKVNDNNFFGSLAPLQKLNKLEELKIEGTKIDSGLEYLSDSCKKIYCQGTELAQKLKNFNKRDTSGNVYYDYQSWKKNHQELIQAVNNPLLKQLKFLLTQLTNKNQEINHLKELITNRPQLATILENSPFNIQQGHAIIGNTIGDNFDASYHLIIKINDNEELIRSQTQEIILLQEKITILINFSQQEKNNLEQEIFVKQEQIIRLKTENKELAARLASCKRLFINFLTKQEQLEKIKKDYLEKGKNYIKTEEKLEELLEAEEEITKINSSFIIKQKEKLVTKITKKTDLTNEELIILCSLQSELTSLEKGLANIGSNSQRDYEKDKKSTKEQSTQTEKESKKIKGAKVILDEFTERIIELLPKNNY